MIPSAYAPAGEPVSAFLQHRRNWQQRQLTNDPANAVYAKYLEATFNNNLPAYPLSSPFNQVQHYKSIVYLGISTLIDAITGCKVGLERRRTPQELDAIAKENIKLGKPSPGGRETDIEYEPLEGHPFCDIIRHPNNVDTFAMFLAQIVIQYHLTGRVMIWGVPNNVGAPERLFVIPTALATPAYGLGNDYYPKGGWRIQQYYPASGLMGILPGPLAGTAGCIIDSREIYILQNPHPLYRWAPVSPMQAAQTGVDLIEMIDQSCWSVMQNGVRPSGVFDMPGAGQPQIEAAQAQFDNKHAGPDNHGRIMVIGGGNPQRPAGTFSSTVPTADVMGFQVEWDRYAGFVLATVCGLDLGVVGLKTSGSYAERWAAIQDVRVRKYEPFLARVADMFTDGPVKDWGLRQEGVRVALALPKMADPTLIEQQNEAAAADGTMTVNEIRARRGQPPEPEIQLADGTIITGDVPTAVYNQLILKQYGLDPITQQMQLAEYNTQQLILQAEAQQEAEGDNSSKSSSGEKKGPGKKKSGSGKSGPPRPKNEGGKGAKGGKGSGPKRASKAISDPHHYSRAAQRLTTNIGDAVARQHATAAAVHSNAFSSESAAKSHRLAMKRHLEIASKMGPDRESHNEAAQLHSDAGLAHEAHEDYHNLYAQHNLHDVFGHIADSDPGIVADYLEENHGVDSSTTHHIREYLAPHWGVKGVLDDVGNVAITHEPTTELDPEQTTTPRDIRRRLATPYEPLVLPPSQKTLKRSRLASILEGDMEKITSKKKKKDREVKAKFDSFDYSDRAHYSSNNAMDNADDEEEAIYNLSRQAVGHSEEGKYLQAHGEHNEVADRLEGYYANNWKRSSRRMEKAIENHGAAAQANLVAHYHGKYPDAADLPHDILGDYLADKNEPEEHVESIREFAKRHKSLIET